MGRQTADGSEKEQEDKSFMSFIDFCFVLFLIWIVLFVILLFYLDGDLSLMWHAKFGRKIYELKDQVVWITGASTGIGASCAIEAAKLGAKLVLSARNEVLLKEVKEKCLDSGRHQGLEPKDVLILPLDLTQFDTHQRSVNKVLDHFGKGYFESLRTEKMATGISVTMLCPGPTFSN